jgi:hypothetical protein
MMLCGGTRLRNSSFSSAVRIRLATYSMADDIQKEPKFHLSRPTETPSPVRYGARGTSELYCVMTVLMRDPQNYKTMLLFA